MQTLICNQKWEARISRCSRRRGGRGMSTRTSLRGRLARAVTAGAVVAACWATLGAASTAHPASSAAANNPPTAPTGLTVGDRTTPLDVEGTPQFGWMPNDPDGNEIQSAYEIQVTRDSDSSTVWDSGKVASSDE